MPPAHHSHASICPPRPTSPTSPTSLTSPTTPPSKKSPHHADKHSEGSVSVLQLLQFIMSNGGSNGVYKRHGDSVPYSKGCHPSGGVCIPLAEPAQINPPSVAVLQLLQLIFGNIQNPSARLLIHVIGSLKEKTTAPPKKHTKRMLPLITLFTTKHHTTTHFAEFRQKVQFQSIYDNLLIWRKNKNNHPSNRIHSVLFCTYEKDHTLKKRAMKRALRNK